MLLAFVLITLVEPTTSPPVRDHGEHPPRMRVEEHRLVSPSPESEPSPSPTPEASANPQFHYPSVLETPLPTPAVTLPSVIAHEDAPPQTPTEPKNESSEENVPPAEPQPTPSSTPIPPAATEETPSPDPPKIRRRIITPPEFSLWGDTTKQYYATTNISAQNTQTLLSVAASFISAGLALFRFGR